MPTSTGDRTCPPSPAEINNIRVALPSRLFAPVYTKFATDLPCAVRAYPSRCNPNTKSRYARINDASKPTEPHHAIIHRGHQNRLRTNRFPPPPSPERQTGEDMAGFGLGVEAHPHIGTQQGRSTGHGGLRSCQKTCHPTADYHVGGREEEEEGVEHWPTARSSTTDIWLP